MSHGLSRAAYLDPTERCFIACLDCEAVISGDDDIDFSGLSLRDSPTIQLTWTGLQGDEPKYESDVTDANDAPAQAFVCLYSNLILSIGLDTVSVLE